jgi:hypothetical protein
MTPDDFRAIALAFPEAIESAHMNHPDFRVGGKIFASLGYPDVVHGMVVLSPEDQATFVRTEPKVFRPANGAWGRQGATIVTLKSALEPTLRQALDAAWRNRAAKKNVDSPGKSSAKRKPKPKRKPGSGK